MTHIWQVGVGGQYEDNAGNVLVERWSCVCQSWVIICINLWLPNLLSVATVYVGYCMFVDLSQRAVLTAKDL